MMGGGVCCVEMSVCHVCQCLSLSDASDRLNRSWRRMTSLTTETDERRRLIIIVLRLILSRPTQLIID